MAALTDATRPRLSICIATYKRARFIGETLQSILAQVEPGVEVVVVDGASPDGTAEVVAPLAAAYPCLSYHREAVNSGVDADYDKAVAHAVGTYCWLMTDDDLLAPGALRRVLAAIEDGPDLVVLNAETRTPDFARVLDQRLIPRTEDGVYEPRDREAFFKEAGLLLSFIGAVVIRREAWLARDRASYYGSLFVHVGVIFQDPPLGRVRMLADPLVRIRWGNAMWSPRAFEVWMFLWPRIVWSFGGFSDEARTVVCPRDPWRNLRMLGLHRALGAYSMEQYRSHLAALGSPGYRLAAKAVAVVPPWVANALAGLYCLTAARWARKSLWDLAHGPSSTFVSRAAARLLGV